MVKKYCKRLHQYKANPLATWSPYFRKENEAAAPREYFRHQFVAGPLDAYVLMWSKGTPSVAAVHLPPWMVVLKWYEGWPCSPSHTSLLACSSAK
eukprot:7692073-Heterocapsa_arctica.AAC.1